MKALFFSCKAGFPFHILFLTVQIIFYLFYPHLFFELHFLFFVLLDFLAFICSQKLSIILTYNFFSYNVSASNSNL